MARHNEPQFVIEWRNRQPPKVCHTCDWYDKHGECGFYKAEPTETFAATAGACDSWVEELPF